MRNDEKGEIILAIKTGKGLIFAAEESIYESKNNYLFMAAVHLKTAREHLEMAIKSINKSQNNGNNTERS